MKLKKMWGWKQDVKFWLYWRWWALFHGIVGILQKEHLEFARWLDIEPSRSAYMSFWQSRADARAGRFWKWEDNAA